MFAYAWGCAAFWVEGEACYAVPDVAPEESPSRAHHLAADGLPGDIVVPLLRGRQRLNPVQVVRYPARQSPAARLHRPRLAATRTVGSSGATKVPCVRCPDRFFFLLGGRSLPPVLAPGSAR